mgnify:CR=1 FL=1
MERKVWHNGVWNIVSGSIQYGTFQTAYKDLTGTTYTRTLEDKGTFGGFYESTALYDGQAEGATGPATGSQWSDGLTA